MSFRIWFILVLAPLTLLSCSNNSGLSVGSGLTPQYVISTDEISTKVSAEFPFKKSVSSFGSVVLSNPRVSMDPNSNKIRIGLNMTGTGSSGLEGIAFLQPLAQTTHSGTCQILCGLRYDRETRSIFLKDPALESLNMPTVPNFFTQNAQRMMNLVAPQLLNQYPVHTLDRTLSSRLLKEIKVLPQGVALKFGL